MATAVPYNPISTVEPELRPRSYMRVDTPLAAFGGNVADSVKGLGQTFNTVGSELYNRAVAMQTLNEQAKATATTADFMTKLGEQFAQYKTLQGDAAVNGYKPFIESLNKLREEMRQTLTSPYAQRAFDNETRNQQARTVMTAAEHSAVQNRNFAQTASAARIQANNNTVLAAPESRESYEAGLRSNEEEIRANAIGKPPEVVNLEIQTTNSKLTLSRIKAIAATDPPAAREMAEEAKRKGRLVGDDIAAADNFIHQKSNGITSREVARGTITGENLAVGGRIVSGDQAVQAVGGVDDDARSFRTIEPGKTDKSSLLGRFRIAEQNLPEMLKAAGMPPMTKDEFLASPESQTKLFKIQFEKLMKEKGSFNAAFEEWNKLNPGKADAAPAQLIQANRILAKKATRTELDEISRQVAQDTDPSNPDLPDLASQQTNLRRTRQEQAQRDEVTRANQILTKILNDKGPDGKLISSEEELLRTPEAQAAWDKLPEIVKKAYFNTLRANARGGYAETAENQLQFNRLRGMMTDPRLSLEDRDEALSVNIGTLAMPAAQRQTLLGLQLKLLQGAINEPNVDRAMRILGPMINGIPGLSPTNRDKDEYNIFRGSLQGIIQDHMRDLKRPLKPEEIRQIGSQLLQDRSYTRWLGMNTTKDKSYKAPVPETFRESFIERFKKSQLREPTDAEISIAYNRQLNKDYQLLNSKPKPKLETRAQ